jgi:hypothetical protein
VIPPPELHLLTGVVHAMYNRWLDAYAVQRDEFHGGSFTGNASRKLLRCADLLRSIFPLEALPFVAAFDAFSQVVVSCFGCELRADFQDSLMSLNFTAFVMQRDRL